MDNSKKKTVMIVIAIVALVGAGLITILGTDKSTDIPDRFKDEEIWMLCKNPDCEASYLVNKKKYYEYVQKNQSSLSLLPPPMVCEECGEKSAYKAYKCEECGYVFLPYEAEDDFADTCPECGHRSEQE